MGLASSRTHMALTRASACFGSPGASSISIYLPWRTSRTPSNPNPLSAWAMALPCGSRTAGFSVICTRAFTGASQVEPGSIDDSRNLRDLAFILRQHAEPARHLLIGFLDVAEIVAEAVHIELFVGFGVPQPAIVRADLVGQHDAHLVALVEPAVFELEIDEPEADAEEEAAEEVVDAQAQGQDVVEILGVGPAEGGDVLLRHHRVVELAVLVVVLDDRARQRRAFGDAEALADRAG